jgi:hypothetical protein
MKKLLLSSICGMCFWGAFAQNPLYIPNTLVGSDIYLNIQNGSKQFYPGQITQTMGVNGDILTPTIIE